VPDLVADDTVLQPRVDLIAAGQQLGPGRGADVLDVVRVQLDPARRERVQRRCHELRLAAELGVDVVTQKSFKKLTVVPKNTRAAPTVTVGLVVLRFERLATLGGREGGRVVVVRVRVQCAVCC